ncbi:hypothetical protein GCM10010970_01350 [Silvimonas iriomotensis]|uniref:Uncharacterized protein n=1 Tax=Silvimonas iriomotensis TaxID=449662 RepID=A0ABQ2P404_9NEIS|nr:hypothetical protein GCM10010970_01350 [Silvimonas iriomotensis]
MWTCKECQAVLTPYEAPPDMDDEGVFFVCPLCSHKNSLQVIESPRKRKGDAIYLVQLDS